MRTPRVTPQEQIARLHASLSTCRARVRSLERANSRLVSTDYQHVAEREIALLTERVRDLEARWLECEMLLLRKERNVA